MTNIVNAINGVVWGPLMLVLILGVGLFLMLGLRLMPLLRLGTGFKLLWSGRTPAKGEDKSGEISPFQALMTALSATVGTGNIAGVATAVFLGGPGALFWMWCTALVGMATKFAEAVLAVKFREVDDKGNHYGGPMYYIKNGLGSRWAWLGTMFALFGACAGFGIGNTVQSNSVAAVLEANFNLPTWITGVALMVLVGMVLIGGIRRIGQVAGALVPFMAIAYLVAGLGVLVINAAKRFPKLCQWCSPMPSHPLLQPVVSQVPLSGQLFVSVWLVVFFPTKPVWVLRLLLTQPPKPKTLCVRV